MRPWLRSFQLLDIHGKVLTQTIFSMYNCQIQKSASLMVYKLILISKTCLWLVGHSKLNFSYVLIFRIDKNYNFTSNDLCAMLTHWIVGVLLLHYHLEQSSLHNKMTTKLFYNPKFDFSIPQKCLNLPHSKKFNIIAPVPNTTPQFWHSY